MRNDNTTEDLGRLLRTGHLPARAASQAERVHDALTRPKRVTVMGPPKTGKSDVLALLAGNRVVGTDVPLGTIRLVYGETAKTTMTMPDGQHHDMQGVPTAVTRAGEPTPVQTTIHAPLPALRKISLMRLVEVNDIAGQIEAMSDAAAESDIVIWCTAKFGAIEKKMWAQMPDKTRDHAIVLRTTLDGFDGNTSTARSDLGKRVGDEFAFVLAADLKTALSAQVSVPIDTEAMKKSGASALISTLLKEIEEGRENASSQAKLILAKYPLSDLPQEEHVAEIAPAPEPVVEKAITPEPVVEKAIAPEPKSEPNPDLGSVDEAIKDLASVLGPVSNAPSRKRVNPSPIRKDPSIFPLFELDETSTAVAEPTPLPAADPVAKPAAVGSLSDDAVVICKDIIVKLSNFGQQDAKIPDHRHLFDAGLEILGWMDEALADVANDDLPLLGRLQNVTEEATDIIQLLRMENTTTAAVDAATILLQIKRGTHAILAA